MITVMDEDGRARAEARRAWTVRRFRLGDEPNDDLSRVTTAQARLAMMWELSLSAWRLAGRPLPVYDRRHAPGKVVRPSP
jgi:hypothetical protein